MWAVAAVVLALGELAAPGAFYMLLLGCAAVIVAAAAGFGLLPGIVEQILLFTIASAILLFFVRGVIAARLRPLGGPIVSDPAGETVRAIGDIPAGDRGQVLMRGTVWIARNVGEEPIQADADCQVLAMEGIELRVRAG